MASVLIPARYGSSRFPGKPLVDISGTPLVVRVARLGSEAVGVENTYVATDDIRIAEVVESYGFNVVMTGHHLTGTDRCAAALDQIELEEDVIVNLQGDEPCLKVDDILSAIALKREHRDRAVNCYCQIDPQRHDPACSSIPKVVINEDDDLIYISRSLIPGLKNTDEYPDVSYFRQVCIAVFTTDMLMKFKQFGRKSAVEVREDIEMLRLFELGIPVKMHRVSGAGPAVDFPSDVQRVIKFLK